MSTLIGVTEDKTEVFFASLPHLKEEYFHQLVDGFFCEGIVSENESGIVLLKEIPEFSLVTNGNHPGNYLMHPYSFVQLRDVTRLWVEWISYHRYEETSYRPLIQNVWLQHLFKRWYKEEKEKTKGRQRQVERKREKKKRKEKEGKVE